MSVAGSLTQALVWYGVAFALSALLYPAVFRATPGLPDRGLSLAGPLGLLFAVAGPWWLAATGITRFTDTLLVAFPLVIGVVLWVWEIRRGEILPYLRRNVPTALLWPTVALALFLGYVVFRGFNPDAAYTEKPMDMAMLASAIRATEMPPPDPWFAGEPINYYYLGYVLMAALARISGTTPGVAFSLSLATTFAYATVAAAGTATNIVRAAYAGKPTNGRGSAGLGGVLGAFLLVGIGNLVAPLRFLRDPSATLEAGWWTGVGWQASRVIVDHGVPGSSGPRPTINEFPAFSFVLGDLHPHVLAYPLFIATIGLAVGLFFQGASGRSRGGLRPLLSPLAASGIVAGTLYAINSWDLPTALALTGGGLLLGAGRCQLRRVIAALGVLVGAALLTALPFALDYTPAVGTSADGIPSWIADLPVVGRLVRTIGIVIWPRSAATSLLTIYGLFLGITALLLSALWFLSPRWRRPAGGLLAAAVPIAVGIGSVARFAALWVIGLPLALLLLLLRRAPAEPALRATGALLAFGWALVLVPEVAFLQDAFGDRMNTVFKVYFQVWAILAVGGASAIVLALPHLRSVLGRAPTWAAGGVLALVMLGAALYPPLSAYRWTDGFREWRGIDALAYIANTAPAEGAAIQWLAENARPGDVVLEAPGCSYGVAAGLPHDRVSMATGIPTVIGWHFHEYQWRSGRPAELADIGQRQEDVNAIYSDPASPMARDLLERYRVRYIYVGTHEREGYEPGCTVGPPYPAERLAAFEQLGWPRVFEQGDVVIFERPDDPNLASRPN